MITLEPFKAGHASILFGDVPDPLGTDREYMARLFAEKGSAFTASEDGWIFAAGGLFILAPGVADAWLMLSGLATKPQQRFIARMSKRFLCDLASVHRLRRVQTVLDEGLEKNNRFLEWLGFSVEGPPLRHYGQAGESYLPYVWFPQQERD